MSGLSGLVLLILRLTWRRRLARGAAVIALLLTALVTYGAHETEGDGFFMVANGLRLSTPLLLALGAVLGAVAIAGESNTGVLRAVLLRPVGRPALVCAHAIVLVLFMVVLHALCTLLAVAIAASVSGFGDVMLDGLYVVISKAALMEDLPPLVMMPLAGLAVAPLAGLLISTIADDPALAIIIALALVLGPWLYGFVTGEMPAWFFTEHALRPPEILHELSQGIEVRADLVASAEFVRNGIVQPLLQGLVLVALSLGLFQRKEITA